MYNEIEIAEIISAEIIEKEKHLATYIDRNRSLEDEIDELYCNLALARYEYKLLPWKKQLKQAKKFALEHMESLKIEG